MNFNLRLYPLGFLFIFIFNSATAQLEINKNFCGSQVPSLEWNNAFQKMVEQRQLNTANKTTQNTYIIPVIVHVIHSGQPVGTYPNIAQGQINSQILVWNNDYAGVGYNTSTYPQQAYANWAIAQNISPASLDGNGRIAIADCGVQFCLATLDTLGNVLPEPGIDRINCVAQGWTNPANNFGSATAFQSYINGTIKPQSTWNCSKYLNIWLTDADENNNGGLLGYATFPPLTGLNGLQQSLGTRTTDGVWCYSKAFGSATTFPTGTYMSGYNRGRVTSHEVGHYLGLRHIWGDAACANDYCNDTPTGSAANFGAPNYPYKTTACPGNSPDGEMFMNFMDYTNDPAKYMFTTDQATRIQTAMANSPYRKFLGTHNLCGPIAIAASFQNTFLACPGVDMTLSNTSFGFPTPSFTWTCNGANFNPSQYATSPTISFSAPGTYVITLAADNGSSTSMVTKTITVSSPPVVLAASSLTICNGESVSINASGSDSYTWQPGNINNTSVLYSPTQSQVFTCGATKANGCQTTATISIIVAECTGINQFVASPTRFDIYPNPAKDLLHITYFSDKSADVTVEVIDALGNLSATQNFMFNKDKQNQAFNIAALANGVYFIKLKSGNAMPQFIKLLKE